MDIIREPKSNYLNVTHFNLGIKTALIWPFLCYIVSAYFWEYSPLKVNQTLVFEKGEYWRLILGLFSHGDLSHFLSNSLFLSFLGFFIARSYGPKVLFGLGLLMAIVTHALTLSLMRPEVGLIGASGLVYAFWGLWFSLYFLIDRHTSAQRRLMKIVAISILLLIPNQFDPQVSYLAHAIGFIIGVVGGCLYFLFHRKYIRSFEKFAIIQDPPPYLTNDDYQDEFWKTEKLGNEFQE